MYAEPELKGSPNDLRGFLHPKANIVVISGMAEEKVYSDKAIVSLVISTEDKLLSLAIESNTNLRRDVTNHLVGVGLDVSTIKSSKFSSSPQYGWFGSKPSSYKVVNRMAVSITEEEHLQEIAKVADKYLEVELSDTEFLHSQEDEYDQKVRAKALEKALKQKAFYEKYLGVKLSPIGLRDSNVLQQGTRGAMVLEEVVVTGFRSSDRASSAKTYKAKSRQSSFDEVQYRASLSVEFKFEE